MNYSRLGREDFDAIVTGELTHYALRFEDVINQIICDYFVADVSRIADFRRLFLFRDGLTFQDKIEIVRGMIPLFGKEAEAIGLKALLREIEGFKSLRNAMAHGLDVTGDEAGPRLKVEIISRSGKEKAIEVTPESHTRMMIEAEDLLARAAASEKHLRKTVSKPNKLFHRTAR